MGKKKSTDPAGKASSAPAASSSHVGLGLANMTAPRELDDPAKRQKWGLPSLDEPDRLGDYIVELNANHLSGLPGAASAFLALYQTVVPDADQRPPLKIAKSYYRCYFKDAEWRELIRLDETHRQEKQRAVYRLWPDFPLSVQTDHSVSTVKSDAALRSFGAQGKGIVWAVVDSGVEASHPHFSLKAGEDGPACHSLQDDEVLHLHRSFAVVQTKEGACMLPDPDDATITPEERAQRLQRHAEHALNDEAGHGTHVAGIIAGRAPASGKRLSRQFRIDPTDPNKKIAQTFGESELDGAGLRGMAPRCKIISLRVLDENGKGKASQVIQALEYIRDKINDNPKLMRVHGVNLSLGYDFDPELFACGQSPLCTAVDRLVQEGVVVVAAAGNTGYGSVAASVGTAKIGLSNTINDPGNAAGAITVGATHRDAPHTYGVSYFSSKGPTGDGRLKPDLVAPGERITSCAAGVKLKEARALSGEPVRDDLPYYVDESGTSMAAPHVSGAIAAFLSIRREFIGKPQEVKRIFLSSATPLGRERYFEGHGLVDLMRAIQSV